MMDQFQVGGIADLPSPSVFQYNLNLHGAILHCDGTVYNISITRLMKAYQQLLKFFCRRPLECFNLAKKKNNKIRLVC